MGEFAPFSGDVSSTGNGGGGGGDGGGGEAGGARRSNEGTNIHTLGIRPIHDYVTSIGYFPLL